MQKKKKICDEILIFVGLIFIGISLFATNLLKGLDGDNVSQTYALFVDVARALHQGEISLWNPYQWGGFPNIGHFITEAFYPFNWLLCNIFYDSNTTLVSYAIIPVNLWIHYSIYYVGMYCLIKNLKFSSVNAFVVSFSAVHCFSLWYFRVWIVYTDGFCWFPWILLLSKMMFEEKSKKKYTYAIILGGVFAFEALVSVSVMLVFSVFMFLGIFLVYIYLDRKNFINDFCLSALSGFIALFLSAPLLFTTIRFMGNMSRYVPNVDWIEGGQKVPYEEFVSLKYSWEEFKDLLNFSANDMGMSVSVIVLILGIIGLFTINKNNLKIYVIALLGTIISFFYSFALIFPRIAYYIPGLNNMREPFMYSILFGFFMALLSAFGFDLVEKKLKGIRTDKKICLFSLLPIIVILCFNIMKRKPYNIFISLLIFIGILLVTFSNAIKKRKIFIYVCMVLVLVGNYYEFFTKLNRNAYSELQAIEKVNEVNVNSQELLEKIDNIEPEDNVYRIMTYMGVCYPSNMSSIIGFRDTIGYLNPTFNKAVKSHLQYDLIKKSKLQNIKYFLVNIETAQLNKLLSDYPDLYIAKSIDGVLTSFDSKELETVTVLASKYNNGDAWLVNDIEWYEDMSDDEVIRQVNEESFDVEKKALIHKVKLSNAEKIVLESINETNEIEWRIDNSKYSNNSVSYDIYSTSSAVLVSTEFYYPGWTVYVNGEKRSILEIDYSCRGVMVPQGKNKVEFRYEPIEFYVGVSLQVFTIILILVFAIIKRKNVRRRRIDNKKLIV